MIDLHWYPYQINVEPCDETSLFWTDRSAILNLLLENLRKCIFAKCVNLHEISFTVIMQKDAGWFIDKVDIKRFYIHQPLFPQSENNRHSRFFWKQQYSENALHKMHFTKPADSPSACPGVPWWAAGRSWGWPRAPAAGRGWPGTAPGCAAARSQP